MADDIRQRIVEEARSWIGTPFRHQQHLRGPQGGVDCVNFIAEVATAAGATGDVEFEKNYRLREDGTTMRRLLAEYLDFVDSFDDARPGDVLAFHDGKERDAPRHVAILSQLEPYPKAVHASQEGGGVREHRIDLAFRKMLHSVWRVRGIDDE